MEQNTTWQNDTVKCSSVRHENGLENRFERLCFEWYYQVYGRKFSLSPIVVNAMHIMGSLLLGSLWWCSALPTKLKNTWGGIRSTRGVGSVCLVATIFGDNAGWSIHLVCCLYNCGRTFVRCKMGVHVGTSRYDSLCVKWDNSRRTGPHSGLLT